MNLYDTFKNRTYLLLPFIINDVTCVNMCVCVRQRDGMFFHLCFQNPYYSRRFFILYFYSVITFGHVFLLFVYLYVL